ncbi:MAG: tRNA (adenosine(37)-N6)-threonylcarbamoyltransferase complex dimerization subunit type 1 TsaB [Ignavibacteriales bacterium]|nr:tRNA (adenosine(37)-N6)-threonylcarbamoyltransferase complex dimerization subunit type 1 TsaB [Ignavibacteriales bacterium]
MIVLGIETSTDVCSVGIFGDKGLRAERSIVDRHIHSEKLLTLTQEVLIDAGMTTSRIDAIAVSIGPGSFTGLRIGLSGAKGLCFSLDRPLAAIPTLHAIAHSVKAKNPRVVNILVALDAKKGDFYAARFSLDGPMPVETLGTTVVAGELLAQFGGNDLQFVVTDKPDILGKEMGTVTAVGHVHEYCRGSVVAELGQYRISSGETVDVRSVEPKYLKDFVVRGKASAA